jgi:hypothetical protein
MSPEQITALAVALLAGSEVLSLMPGVRANGWVQLVLGILEGIADSQQKSGRRRR